MSDELSRGSMKLFHPRGPQVTLPVLFDGDYRVAFAAVGAALDAGFLAEAPGLEQGEEKEEIAWVLRAGHEKDGETTPVVVLYSANDGLTWPILKVYLNKQADIEAFEHASKMKLDKLPEYVGNDRPQRGASQKTDTFIVKAAKPFGVVFKRNPRHDDTDAGKMKPARLFVRWTDMKPAHEPENGDAGIRANLDKYIADKGLPAAADLVLKGLGKEGLKEADALRTLGLTDRKGLTVQHVVTMRGDLAAITEGGARAEDLYPSEAARTDRSKRLGSKGGVNA
jgi:hypothetical protein